MDDLDLEKLKQELDDVSGGSRYDIDDIMREAGASEPEPDKEDLEQLMQRFGISVEETAAAETASLSRAEGRAAPVTQEMMPEMPDFNHLSALFRATEQTQELIEQQNELAEESEGESEAPDPLAEQDDVFAQLFAQLGEIERDPVDDMFQKPEGHTQTEWIDPRTELEEEPEEEPDLMARLFEHMDLPQADESEDEEKTTVFVPDHSEEDGAAFVHIDTKSSEYWGVPEADLPETEVFEPVTEQATQVLEPEEDELTDEAEESEEPEEPEEAEESEELEEEPAGQPKKSFWSKWFGADDDEEEVSDQDNEDVEVEAEPDNEEEAPAVIVEPIAAEPQTEVFEPVTEQATQVLEPDEDELTDEAEESEELEEEPAEQPKKNFWSKWFGADDEEEEDSDEDNEDIEAEAEPDNEEEVSAVIVEPIAAEPQTEVFEPVTEQATQVLEPDEPEEDELTDEAEEPEESEEPEEAEESEEPEEEPAEQPKKNFWSKWFGADDDEQEHSDEDNEDVEAEAESDDEEEASAVIVEPIASEPEGICMEEDAPDTVPAEVSDEPEEINVVPQPIEEDSEPEEMEDAGIAAFEDAMAQEQAIGATEETPEPPRPRPRPEDTPVISEEELEEFLSGIQVEDDTPHVSFEQILCDNGMEPEEPETPVQKKISLEEFPEKETTVYFDVPVKEPASDEPRHTELFDAEAEMDSEPEERPVEQESEPETGNEIEPEHAQLKPEIKPEPEPDPEWLGLPLEQVCEFAPALEELRREGPVMAREVARQKDWILGRRRMYLEAQRAAQQPPEAAETPTEEDDTEPDDSDVIHAAGELRALLEQEAAEEGRDSVFHTGLTDKPETEPAGRETGMTETVISLEISNERMEEKGEPEKPEIPPEEQLEKTTIEGPSRRKKPEVKQKKQRAVWPKEEAPRDLHKASKAWRQRARAQAQRSVLVIICAVIAIYISCAADFSILPLPASLNYVESPTTVLIAFIVLQLIAMLIAYDVVAEGIQAALHRSPNFSTLVDLALVLNLIHCITRLIWEGEEIPYTCVALLTLFAQMRARVSDSGARHYVYKVAANAQQPMGIFCHNGDNRHLVKAPMKNTDAFVAQTVLPAEGQKVERIVTILATVIAVILSGIVCAATGDAGRLTYVLAATMTGACQIALLSAVPMARNHAARHMMKGGSAVDGMHGAWNIASADMIVLTDEDLFPTGSVALERLELRSNLNDATALAYAAALAGESSLGRMLAEEVRARYGASLVAHHIVRYTGGGMGGHIGGLEILLGGADFMAERGVSVNNIPENGLVLAVDGDVAAVLVIDYHVPAAQFNAIQVLTERRMKILLHTRNYQVTPQLVERLYGLHEGTVLLPDLEHDRALRNAHYLDGDVPCGILLRDGLVPLADCVSTAQTQARLALAGSVIGIGASVICMLLMMYLCYVFVPVDARPIRLLLYMILCFIPIFFIENGVGRE